MNNRKSISKVKRKELYDKMNGRCAYCGEKIDIKQMQLDHIKPLYLDGKDEIYNLICSCRKCNHYKSTLTLEKYREHVKTINNRLMKNVTFANALRYGMVSIHEKEVVFYFEQIIKEKGWE